MNDEQLLRYSRHIMLADIDIVGQEKILASKVLLIGLGGLGSPVSMYLASSGVGHITLVDFDHVENSNLQRQIAHSESDIGRLKVESAKDTLVGINSEITIETISHALEGEELLAQVQQADIVVDATDNLATRFAINQACVTAKTPLVSGAAIRFEGQIMVYRPDVEDAPCYRCLYRSEQELDERCSESGVLAPMLGVIGSIQAIETIKLLTGAGETLGQRMLMLDAREMEWHSIKIRRNPSCPVCSVV